MSTLLVPSIYTTIQSAIDSAVAGDVIVISEGSTALSLAGAVGYKESLDLTNKNDIVLRAAFGQQVNIQGVVIVDTHNLQVKLDGAERITFRDLCFHPHSTSSPSVDVIAGYSDTVCRSIAFIDCLFRIGSVVGTTTFENVLRLGAGTSSRPTVVRRCWFFGPVTDTAGIIVLIEDSNGSAIVESCKFSDLLVSDSVVTIVLSNALAGDFAVIRNNSLRKSEVAGMIWSTYTPSPPSGVRCAIYNNIADFSDGTISSYVDNIVISDYADLEVAVVSNNTLFKTIGSFSTNSFVPNTADNSVTSPGWGTAGAYNPGWGPFGWNDPTGAGEGIGVPTQGEGNALIGINNTASHSYHSGIANAGAGESGAVLDILRLPFASPPSRGCFELQDNYVNSTDDWESAAKIQCLHVKYKNVDITNGLSITVGDTVLNLASERRSYDTPFEVAKHLEILIGDDASSSDVEVWYDPYTNRYKMQSTGLFTVETSGFSLYLLGTGAP